MTFIPGPLVQQILENVCPPVPMLLLFAAGSMSHRNIAQHGNPREHRNIMKCFITEFVNVGMPKQALLTSMRARMAPASSFCRCACSPCAVCGQARQCLTGQKVAGSFGLLLCARIVILASWCIMDVKK